MLLLLLLVMMISLLQLQGLRYPPDLLLSLSLLSEFSWLLYWLWWSEALVLTYYVLSRKLAWLHWVFFWYIYIIMINAAVYDLMFRFFRVLHTLVLSQSPSSSKGKTCQHKLIGKTCYIDLHLPFVPKNISIFEISLILVFFPSFVITEQPGNKVLSDNVVLLLQKWRQKRKLGSERTWPSDQTSINE